MDRLAIHGGEKAVKIQDFEMWKRPVEKEKQAVCSLIEKGEISGAGKGLPKQFEEDFNRYIGSKYCLSINHGSTALASAYYAVGVGPGDEIITPAAGYIGSYSGALHIGAIPVFCDIDPDTLLMDPEDVEQKITDKTKAINAVHMNGKVCDMESLIRISRKYGIPIVEDAAHAAGAMWRDKKVGNISDITCFSLQGKNPLDKPVCGGEGGVVTTNSRKLYQRQLIYCHLHRYGIMSELIDPEYKIFDEEVLGLKYRAHPLALAIAKISLKSLDYRNAMIAKNKETILKAICSFDGIKEVKTYPDTVMGGFFGGIQIIYEEKETGGLPAEKFVEALNAEGAKITGPSLRPQIYGPGSNLEHIRPIAVQGFDKWIQNKNESSKYFKKYKKGDFPKAEAMAEKVLTIPAFIEPTRGLVAQYIYAFEKVISNHRKLL